MKSHKQARPRDGHRKIIRIYLGIFPKISPKISFLNGVPKKREGTEVNISPKINISAHTPKMALHENPAPPGSWIVIFLHGTPKKASFYA